MNKKDYPEHIYCHGDRFVEFWGGFFETPKENQDNTEYVRADLVPKWHDVKKELPPLNENGESDYVVAVDADNCRAVAWYADNPSDKGWFSFNRTITKTGIVAWCSIPKLEGD